ncbi:MlaD family protein [Myxococcota bacterium]|nr:MlaD family protein [Myxococcota bacterium]
MNLTRAEKVRLGTFVATSLVLLAGAVLSLAGLKVWERRDLYTTRFVDNVSGLERSAQVKYQGLRVGRVEEMKVAPDDPQAIEVTISLEAGTKLYEGTRAVLEMSGITGLKTINLTAGDPRKPVIPPGSRLPAESSFMDKLTGQAESIVVKLEVVANQLARFTSDENRRRVEDALDAATQLMRDVDAVVVDAHAPLVAALEETSRTGAALRGAANETTSVMKDVRGELRETLANTRGAIAEAQRILKAVDSKSVASTVDSTAGVMNKLDQRLSDAELGQTLTEMRTTLANLTKLMGELDLAVRASREDFVASMAQIRQSTEDLREFSRIIAQDPSVLLRGKEVGE